MNGVADPGLQPERTALAWQRTSLALIGLSLASARLTWPLIGVWGLLLSGLGVAIGTALLFGTRPRYARHATALAAGEGAGDGVAPLFATVLTVAIALAALGSILLVR